MSKSIQNFIIGLGLLSILVAVIGLLRGDKFIEVLNELVIGSSLIAAIYYEKTKAKDKPSE